MSLPALSRAHALRTLAALVVGLASFAFGPAAAATVGTGSISGSVSLGTASTLAGSGEVRVYYSATGQPASLDESRSALTDASGVYTLGSLGYGDYYLFFDYAGTAGYSDTWIDQAAAETVGKQSQYLTTNATILTGVDQTLGLPGSIAGTVTLAGTTDLPAAGEVLVSYAAKTGYLTMSAESTPVPVAAGGAYVLPDLPDGQYAVHYTYAGAGPFQSVWAGGSYEMDSNAVVLVNPGTTTNRNQAQPGLVTITGQLRIGEQLPAAGAVRLDFERRINWVWTPVAGGTVVTGADGRYSLGGLISVPYRATVTYLRTDGHAVPVTKIPDSFGYGQSYQSDWSPSITPAVNITGKIYLGDFTPAAVAGAGAVAVEYRLGTTLVKSALTDSNGEFRIAQLPVLSRTSADVYQVTLHYLGSENFRDRQWSDKPTTDGDSRQLLVFSTAAFTGHVTLGSAGVSAGSGDVLVTAGWQQTYTDAAGNYQLAGMRNGNYKLFFQYEGRGNYASEWWEHAPIADVAQTAYVDGNGTVVDMQLPDAGSISGRLTTPSGAPAPYVGVELYYSVPPTADEPPGSPDHRVSNRTVTDANGLYSFLALRPEQYQLEFTSWSDGWFAQSWGGTALDPDGQSFELVAGAALTKDAVIGRAWISGNGTCPSCGTVDFYNARSQYTVEVLDPATSTWVELVEGVLEQPTAHFSYAARYPGTYRVSANYRLIGGAWGSGYSQPLVVAGADVSTSVPMLQSASSRIGGQGRFDVSAGISQLGFDPGVPVVYIANGMNFPDALSAAPAASLQGGPLLLVTPTEIPAPVAAEIARLQPTKIVVVGGPASVSPAVFNQLGLLAPEIVRLGGLGRYDVSRAVAEYAFGGPGGPGATVAYIATGRNFPDALSAGGAAALQSAPVITVDGEAQSIDAETRQLLIDLGVGTVKIAGGPGSVSAALMASIDAIPGVAVERLWGPGRYEASGAINREAFSAADVVFLSVGTNYPDALSGGALAGLWEAPLYVIPSDCIPYYVLNDIRLWSPERVIVLGGPGSVQASVLNFAECPRR